MPRYRYPINFDAPNKEKAREIASIIDRFRLTSSTLDDANADGGPLERRSEHWYQEDGE